MIVISEKKKKRFRVKVRHDYENEYEIGVQIMSKQVIKCVFQVRTLEARFHCNMNIEKSKVNRLVNRHISKKPVWEQFVSSVSDH